MDQARPRSRWVASTLTALIVATLMTEGVVAAPMQASTTEPPAPTAVNPSFSTWYQTRPEMPPAGIEMHVGEPDYVDDGPGNKDTEADVPTDAPTQGALDTTGLVTPAVRALAQSLGDDPKAIYHRLRNTFEFEPYYFGLVKGTQETLDQAAGNDVDLATLLIALLRSGGTPARYAQRTVKIPAATASSWVGVADSADVIAMLSRSSDAGISAIRQGSLDGISTAAATLT